MIKYLSPAGVFLFYTVVNFIGILFQVKCVKETSGLSDKQKKQLYIPRRLLNVKDPQHQGQGGTQPTEPELELEMEESYRNEGRMKTESIDEDYNESYEQLGQSTMRSEIVEVSVEKPLEVIDPVLEQRQKEQKIA